MILVKNPDGRKYRIETKVGHDGDDMMAILYKKDRHFPCLGKEVDRLVFDGSMGGTVSANTTSERLIFTEKEIPQTMIDKEEAVHHPAHYNSHPEGIEAYLLTKHENFLLGNVFKYLLRHGLKGEDILEDVNKALEYLQEYAKYVEQYGEDALPAWRLRVRSQKNS